jgi:hypothetical protein
MRRSLAIALVTLAVPVVAAPPDAAAGGGRHPLFSDPGAMTWYSSLAEAQAAARASNRLIFIESGRLACGQCRRLVSQILPVEPIRSRISAAAVGLADDCDADCSDAAPILRANLPGATMLPLCGFVTPDLRWVTGWYGGTTPAAVQQQLSIAEDRLRKTVPTITPGACKVPGPCAPGGCATPGACSVPGGCSVPGACAPPATTPRPPTVASRPASPTPPPTMARPTPPFRAEKPPVAAPAPPPQARAPAPPPFVVSRPVAPPPPRPAPPPIARATPPAPAPAAPPAFVRAPQPVALRREPTPIERARVAAASGEWGEVLRIHEGPGRFVDAAETAEMANLVDRANQWIARSMSEAEKAAAERQADDALEILDRVGRELLGTTHPASIDAERGEDAVRSLVAVEESEGSAADSMRKDAYSRFRGSRWAPLFRSR